MKKVNNVATRAPKLPKETNNNDDESKSKELLEKAHIFLNQDIEAKIDSFQTYYQLYDQVVERDGSARQLIEWGKSLSGNDKEKVEHFFNLSERLKSLEVAETISPIDIQNITFKTAFEIFDLTFKSLHQHCRQEPDDDEEEYEQAQEQRRGH